MNRQAMSLGVLTPCSQAANGLHAYAQKLREDSLACGQELPRGLYRLGIVGHGKQIEHNRAAGKTLRNRLLLLQGLGKLAQPFDDPCTTESFLLSEPFLIFAIDGSSTVRSSSAAPARSFRDE